MRRPALKALGAEVLGELSKSERSGWEWLSTKAKNDFHRVRGRHEDSQPDITPPSQAVSLTWACSKKTGAGRATVYRILRK